MREAGGAVPEPEGRGCLCGGRGSRVASGGDAAGGPSLGRLLMPGLRPRGSQASAADGVSLSAGCQQGRARPDRHSSSPEGTYWVDPSTMGF